MSRTTVAQLAGAHERFWAKVVKGDDCWEWTGCKTNGYGRFKFEGKMVRAHRWSYEQAKGRIPDGLQIDHLCRNTSCVNPDHLEAVTAFENTQRSRWVEDGLAKRKRGPRNGTPRPNPQPRLKHCKRGHEFTPENTYIWRKKNGKETHACRACHRAAQDRRRGKVSSVPSHG